MAVIPGQGLPDGKPSDDTNYASDVKALQLVTEDTPKQAARGVLSPWEQGRSNFFDNIIGGIGSAISAGIRGIVGGISGIFSPVREAAEEIKNGQDGLESAVNFLTGIHGYGFCYMSRNVRLDWGIFSNNVRRMPFDRPLGPAKATHIDSQGRLVLDGTGMWLVMVKNHAGGSQWGGNAMIQQTVRVRRPDGSVYHVATDDASTYSAGGVPNSAKGAATLLSIFPVVIDEPGCTIDVETWSGAWRTWDGGYRYSMMAAIRHSTDVQNRGEETVRDETEEEARRN